MPKSDKNIHQSLPSCTTLKIFLNSLAHRIAPPCSFTSHQTTRVVTTTHIFIHFHCINQQLGYHFWHGYVSTDHESIEVKNTG